MGELFTVENVAALFSLTAIEIVLGIDNLVFLAIVTGRLPEHERDRARRLGLLGAMFTRVGLLLGLSWIIGLTTPLFHLLGRGVSGRDLALGGGGLFLLAKATQEIREEVVPGEADVHARPATTWIGAVAQIAILDVVFSLDSVVTAVGMSDSLVVMIAAIVIAIGVMIAFSRWITAFLQRNPTTRMLALSFLLLVGMMLVAEATGRHIERGYLYFAMAFSLTVEVLNLRAKPKPKHQAAAAPATTAETKADRDREES
jgi:predicted tellurium resistance membrane protein TerC